MSDEVVEEANKSDLAAKVWCDAREPAKFVVATRRCKGVVGSVPARRIPVKSKQ
jgi:hypothetical protein